MTLLLVAAALAAVAASCLVGASDLRWSDALRALFGGGSEADRIIVHAIRLPRAAAALVVGIALGGSGAALQGLLRNPLAEPGVLGVSASAALGATFALYFGLAAAGPFILPTAAILGALAATAVIAGAALRTDSILALILVGVGLSSFAGALMALLTNLAPNPFSLSEMVQWMLGSVANRSVEDLLFAAPFLIAGLALLLGSGRGLAALALGEEAAAGVGLDVPRLRLLVVLGARVGHRGGGFARRSHRLRRNRRPAPRAPAGAPRSGAEPHSLGAARRPPARGVGHRGPNDRRRRRAQTRSRSSALRRPGLRLDRRAPPPDPDMSDRALALRMSGLGVALRRVPVLHDCALAVAPGEMVALAGPNGSGKTTLLRAALALVPRTAGEVSLFGEDPADLTPAARARSAAYLPQSRPLAWPSRVLDLVALGRFAWGVAPGRLGRTDAAAVERAMRSCDLEALAEREANTLSGGELARVHCARALAAETPLLFADEPVEALDPRHQHRIMRRLRRYVEDGGAALVVLHDVALAAAFADRIVWIREGRILGGGARPGSAHAGSARRGLRGRRASRVAGARAASDGPRRTTPSAGSGADRRIRDNPSAGAPPRTLTIGTAQRGQPTAAERKAEGEA